MRFFFPIGSDGLFGTTISSPASTLGGSLRNAVISHREAAPLHRIHGSESVSVVPSAFRR